MEDTPAGTNAGEGDLAGGGDTGTGTSRGAAQGSTAGDAAGGTPGGIPGGAGAGAGNGPLTPAEQVAILDARLEQSTGEFDGMILQEQEAQRREARERPASTSDAAGSGQDSGAGGGGLGGPYGGSGPEGGYAAGGGYSTGGGMGGAGGGRDIPANTAKYPPPKDIPSGDDDDVVARQLREAAMREPDPAVREKLWDEYRKYKGIGQ